jgi:hypothetical protein
MADRVAGAPLRSPPMRKDATGPQRPELASPLRSLVLPIQTPGPGNSPDSAGSRQLPPDLGTFRKKQEIYSLISHSRAA